MEELSIQSKKNNNIIEDNERSIDVLKKLINDGSKEEIKTLANQNISAKINQLECKINDVASQLNQKIDQMECRINEKIDKINEKIDKTNEKIDKTNE